MYRVCRQVPTIQRCSVGVSCMMMMIYGLVTVRLIVVNQSVSQSRNSSIIFRLGSVVFIRYYHELHTFIKKQSKHKTIPAASSSIYNAHKTLVQQTFRFEELNEQTILGKIVTSPQ